MSLKLQFFLLTGPLTPTHPCQRRSGVTDLYMGSCMIIILFSSQAHSFLCGRDKRSSWSWTSCRQKLRSQTTTTNVLPSASSSGSPWRHPRTPWCRPSSFWCSLPWTHTGSRWKRRHQKPADHELVVSWTAQTPERQFADSLPPPDWTQLALFIICNLVTYNIYNI